LSKMFFRCCCTVCGETTSWAAISLVDALQDQPGDLTLAFGELVGRNQQRVDARGMGRIDDGPGEGCGG